MMNDSEIIGGKLKGWGVAIRIIGVLVAGVAFVLKVGLSFGFDFMYLSNQNQLTLITAVIDGLGLAGRILLSSLLSGLIIEGIGQIVINTGAAATQAVSEREETATVVDEIYEVDAPTIFGDPNK